MAKLTELLDELRQDLNTWYGIRLSRKLLKDILTAQHVIDDLHKWGVDTVVREQSAAAISKHVCGKDWPINCDPDDVKIAFYKAFGAKAKSFGIDWDGAE